MQILQVVQGFPPESIGGTELYCQALTRALQERGHRCVVLAGSKQPAKEPALVTTDEEGTRVTRYVTPLPLEWRERQIDPYNPEAELLIRQYLEKVRPDVIHVHHWLRLTNNIVSLAAELGIPAIVTLHDLWTSCARIHRQHRIGHFCRESPSPSLCGSCVERSPWQRDAEIGQAIELRQEQIAEELRLACRLLVPSEAHRQFLSRLLGMSPDHLRVVPHGSIVRLFPHTNNNHPRFPDRPLRLAYWGYLVDFKGVHLLLEAVQQLKDPFAVEVYLSGLAPDARYFEYLQRLADGLAVTFTGEYQPTDLARLDVDMAVFPSLAYESYGFVLDEAIQLGLPVIVSDRGALPMRVGEAGLIFSAGDARALASRIQEVLDTPSLLRDMRQRLPSFPSPPMVEHTQALEVVYQAAMRMTSPPSKASDSGPCPPQPASVLRTAPRRLVYLQTLLAARDQEIQHLKRDLQQQGTVLEHQKEEISRRLQEEVAKTRRLEVRVDEVSRSFGWRFLQRYYNLRVHFLAPPGTRRGRFYDRLKRVAVAYANGGFSRLVQKARQQLDQATTPDPYQLWLSQHDFTPERIRQLREEVQTLVYQPKISIVMPVYNTEETWLRKAIESVRNQIYPNWELCIYDDGSTARHVFRVIAEYLRQDERIRMLTGPQNRGISAASNSALSLATGEFVGFLDHDDELTLDALCEVVKLLNEQPDLDFIYTDEDKLTLDGRRVEPFFKPDWSPDLLLSCNYITHFAVVRRSVVQAIGGFTEGLDGSQDHDLFLRLSEKTQRIGHIARPLYSWRKIPGSAASDTQAKPYAHVAGRQALREHLRRRGIAGEVVDGLVSPSHHRVRYQITGQPLVSIIIPIRDRVELLSRCLESIEEKTDYRHFEVIIVDNQSEEPETLAYLARLSHTVVPLPGPFNYSHLNNVGATHARGEFLLFLNNDTEVIADEWLTAMIEHAQRPHVGAVGAKLLYPDRTIQHAGLVLGLRGVAGYACGNLPEEFAGYFGLPQIIRNCGAVTAACMMMRKSVFAEVGGFDENIKVAYNDVDLCLRIREKGYVIVYTPYAVLYHLESATRKKLHPLSDEEYVRKRWGSVLQAKDPYYNPHLSLERPDFSLRILDKKRHDSTS